MGLFSFFDRFRGSGSSNASGGDRSPWGDFSFESISARTGSGMRVSPDSALRLSNALRHAPVGGVVSVRIESSSREIGVTVENTGKEIPPDVLPRLFDRFYRADSARRHPASDRAGLGLSITKAIVEAHGGAISATSDRDWTRFRLVFPERRSKAEATA